MKINIRCPYCNSENVDVWRAFGIMVYGDDAFTQPKGYYFICKDCAHGFNLIYHEGKKATKDQIDTLKRFEEIEELNKRCKEEETDGN